MRGTRGLNHRLAHERRRQIPMVKLLREVLMALEFGCLMTRNPR